MQAKPRITLAASMLVTFVLGSVHAFSVFIVPLELLFGLARSEISLIYSLALVAITLAVTIGYRIYGLLPAWWLVFITCLVAATGLLLASAANSWWMLVAGYSLAFGFSNGVGYGFSLQLVGRVMPHNKGFSMGAVTAAYAVGSIVFVKIFAWRITQDSVASAFLFIAWGFAGLLAPWSAGLIYDLRGDYELAMVIAAVVALLSAVCAGGFRLGKTT
ncbi:MAG: OFA family MFS transporter [Gammaproteobacteria bacterium]|nr:OFA family MFS transporter [Gammaproteobacteria bacterium]